MIGAVLAGGSGSRIGGAKATRMLADRPLASYPAEALSAVCDRVAIVAKSDSELPELDSVERWDEPAEPRHPLTGLIHALETAGQAVLVCAADMPFVTPDALATLLASARAGSAAAAVAVGAGRTEPVLGVYAPSALAALREASPDAPLTDTVDALDPVRVALPPALLRSVNTPAELDAAEAELSKR